MKKFVFYFLILFISAFISAQGTNITEVPQKPSKEDFFHTWVTERIEPKAKYSIDLTFLNEASYIHDPHRFGMKKQNLTISKWEEAVNTYADTEEYPYGFKISTKQTKNGSIPDFAVFINVDKNKFLYVIDLGFYTQLDIYTKK